MMITTYYGSSVVITLDEQGIMLFDCDTMKDTQHWVYWDVD